MSQEKCNFHYEEREQVWSQIRNCRNEDGEIVNDLVREDGTARIMTDHVGTKRRGKKFCVYFSKGVVKIPSEESMT